MGRAAGWRECISLYSLTGGPLQRLPVTGLPVPERAISSAVRALASHARGQRFKSFIAHHPSSFSSFPRFSEKSRRDVCLNNGQDPILQILAICEPEAQKSWPSAFVTYPLGLLAGPAPHGVRRRFAPPVFPRFFGKR